MLGLVLEGGGAKGAYQIGAWRAFRELGLEFSAVTGTSAGALNGALVVQGDYERAYELWYHLKPEQVIHGDPKAIAKLADMEFGTKDLQPLIQYGASVFSAGGLDVSPLERLLRETIDEQAVRRSRIAFGMVTVSLTDFKPMELFCEEIPEGQLHAYLLASSNLPVFKLNRLDGKLYVDGGFYDNLPVNLIARKGIRSLVAVELRSIGMRQPIREEGLEIRWVTPSEDIGRLLEFNPAKIRRNLELGYFDALKALKPLGGRRYYLEGALPEGWGLSRLRQVPAARLKAVQQWMGLEDMDPDRFLFELLLPKLAEVLEVAPEENYDALVLALYEESARQEGIERLQRFSAQAFLEQVATRCDAGRPDDSESLLASFDRRIRQSPIYLKTRRDQALPWVLAQLLDRKEGDS